MYNYTEDKQKKAPKRKCNWEKCCEDGEYMAPKTKPQEDVPRGENDYHWFCLEHIREYNKSWDFFSGMNEEEVKHFQKESITGHRKTDRWNLSSQPGAVWRWEDKIFEFTSQFDNGNIKHESARPSIPKDLQKAAEQLNVSLPEKLSEVKKHYKLLVKRYHPDVNKGCKASEEKLKYINEAYRVLIKCDYVSS